MKGICTLFPYLGIDWFVVIFYIIFREAYSGGSPYRAIYLITIDKFNKFCVQINDNGCCDGVGGKDVDHVYRQCTKIARLVLSLL